MRTCSGVGRAVRMRFALLQHAAEASHAHPVVFVFDPAAQADLVCPVAVGISDRECKLMLASKEQS